EQTLEILERMLGSRHPSTSNSAWNLLWLVHQLNDSDAAAHLIEKLRWLLDHDEDSIPSALQRGIRRGLLKLLTPS
ncbi:MAG TPA: hypothetical protein VLQ45_15490, partial [Thermoanaerobaculia bacterium]|nr:hypothetical protein [Thermoanaerobaculia bacterium]